jgi:hypothetical protein
MKMTMIRILILTILVSLIATCAEVNASEVEKDSDVSTASYKVTDLLRKVQVEQNWEFEMFMEEPLRYTLRKHEALTGRIVTGERGDYWKTESLRYGMKHYQRELLSINPAVLSVGESTFGRVELINVETREVESSWPITGSLETLTSNGDILRATFTTFISKEGRRIITKIFRRNQYHLPLFERHQFLNLEEKIVEDIIFSKN